MGNESPKSIGRFIIPAIAIGLIINAKTGTQVGSQRYSSKSHAKFACDSYAEKISAQRDFKKSGICIFEKDSRRYVFTKLDFKVTNYGRLLPKSSTNASIRNEKIKSKCKTKAANLKFKFAEQRKTRGVIVRCLSYGETKWKMFITTMFSEYKFDQIVVENIRSYNKNKKNSNKDYLLIQAKLAPTKYFTF